MDYQVYKSTLSNQQLNLLKAVEFETLSTMQFYDSCIEKSDQDEQFTYILLVAALKRPHKAIAKFLIKKNWTVKSPQKTGFYLTPLYYAVKMGDEEIFRALWRKGASIWDKDVNQESALELAMLQDKTDMINYVLNDIRLHKKSRELKPECEGDVALFHAACWVSNVKTIELFLSLNFSIRLQSRFNHEEWKGFTPMHFTVEGKSGLREPIPILLKHSDVDLLAQDGQGRTCINLAFRKDKTFLFFEANVIERMRHSNGSRFINPTDRNGLSHFHIFCSAKFNHGDTARRIDFIKHFIDGGVDLNNSVSLEDKNFPGYTALHFATGELSGELFQLLLEKGADPTKSDKRGRTPLHLACFSINTQRKQCLNIFKLLLKHGADPNAKDSEGRTPLQIAFYMHHDEHPLDESEKLLLSRNQQGINHIYESGVSYLHIACTGDDLGIVETLVKNGAPINSRTQSTWSRHKGYSPLHFAVETQKVDIVEFLLTHGADPNCVSDSKITPLHLACRHVDLQFILSEIGENDMNDEIDWLPSRANHIRIIELLFEHGALMNIYDGLGHSLLLENCLKPHISYDKQKYLQNQKLSESFLNELFIRQKMVMDILLRHGADIKGCSSRGGGLLHNLISGIHECPLNRDLIRMALEKGANVNAIYEYENTTPLYLAVEVSMLKKLDMSLINLLLQYGADINGKCRYLVTPLHRAFDCYHSCPEQDNIIGNLLDHSGIDLNPRNSNGRTPLHVAVGRCNFFLIKKTLGSGADINVENNDGHPPFHQFLSCLERYGGGWRNEEDAKILEVIVSHVKKLMKLNFFVSEKVLDCFEKLSQYLPKDDLALMDSEIDNEIKKLKSEKMDQYTSLYDVIFKSLNSLAKYSQNENLLKVITSIRAGQGFAIFGDIINRQYIKGCRRHLVLEPAKTALNIVTSMNWPYCCSEEILSNLSDQDLKNLIDCSSTEANLERPLKSSSRPEIPVAKIPRIDD